ncbi:nitrite reductase large subunit NirB [Salibacterium qingdaonense]|uniref:Nitrite reductase (NADH) large subunit n=1 Tax=Salibacterium qingdaonense TaxID=266892 RepID=A0A1I4I787_9BACI|nr:nitrite reductase large subunit NirB [Salibacterium qingdaonense]SFL49963.1 nitrite reductase (NADH) large subunit [Salibacterium qingdaonense]
MAEHKEQLVVIGNGMAGVRTVEEILKKDPERYKIIIFGKEPHPNYNRISLSSVLQGDTELDDIILNTYEWYEQNNITLYTGDPVVDIDTKKQTITSENNVTLAYDRLILATGSNPFMLPLPGADKEGVIAFRDIEDCETMINASSHYQRAAVIGGGLLGLEAARGLLNLNMETEVIHLADSLMERQLDSTAGTMLKEELEQQGMRFHMEKQTEQIVGGDRVEGLYFKDGTKLYADLIVMAVGIKPNIALAQKAGIETNRAVVVNNYMEADVPNVYAVGECAEHNGIAYGLVAPLYEQAKVLADRLCDDTSTAAYNGSLMYTQLKVSGVDVFSAGDFMDGEGKKAVRVHDEFEGVYKKVMVQDEKVVGSVLFGDTSDSPRLLDMMKKQEDIGGMSKAVLLPSEGTGQTESPVLSMAPEETICGCNGVSKEAIVQSIEQDGLTSVEEIKQHTNASRSCGGCKPLVSDLLQAVLGDEGTQSQIEPMCGCTTMSHEQVQEAIRSRQLTHTREVMNVLGWEHEEGCTKCRPAINYYLGVVHPETYEDDDRSRFVNERMHANIQNDGTYSVVPRMYGGVTNSDQLRKIANVADKYEVPMLKLTGGQRIDMLGVNKEDLPEIWSDLDMPSGHAYGKAIRTVKTCVGEDFCRFGTQDSIGMGIAIEKKFERLNTPHKIKMAVSACPRNCAESGIKDIGIVGVEGAWEMYVGGNGGVELRAGDKLVKVESGDELLEIMSAFMQYYREDARYLERTSHWVDRVGLDHIRSTIIDDKETRQFYKERMDHALEHKPEDPWASLTHNENKRKELFERKAVELV